MQFQDGFGQLGRALNHARSNQQLCQLSCHFLSQQLALPDAVIYLKNPDLSLTQTAAAGPKAKDLPSHALTLPQGKGVVGQCAVKASTQHLKDTRGCQHYVIDDIKRRSELAVPIIHQGELLGVIDAEHDQQDYFHGQHLDSFHLVATLLAPNLKLLEHARHSELYDINCDDFVRFLLQVLRHYHSLPTLLALPALAHSTTPHQNLLQLKQDIQHLLTQWRDTPARAQQYRLLHRSVLQGGLSPMALAEQFNMGYSTFRRHLKQAKECLAYEIWQQHQVSTNRAK